MFDSFDDAGVIDAIVASARQENAGCARRLAAIGELYARRAPADEDERALWLLDGHESLTAEVAAALGISRGRAAGQLRYAIALREDLPKVAAVFGTGVIDLKMVAVFVGRVELIVDAELMAEIDAALARHAVRWRRLSQPKLMERVDWWIARLDPAGVKQPTDRSQGRFVDIEPSSSGLATVWASLYAPDAALLDQRLDAMAAAVCAGDPRSDCQRRADALGALAAGADRLACGCGSPDCAAGAKPVRSAVIHVLAERSTLSGASQTPGYLAGFGPLSGAAVRELAATAKLKPLIIPTAASGPEPGYRPSRALAEFVRARDLACRFPGCDKPAQVCDIDHTIPYGAGGPTHAANLKLLCRFHTRKRPFTLVDQRRRSSSVVGRYTSGQQQCEHALRQRQFGHRTSPSSLTPRRGCLMT
jgi:Domain of unknown function (DUF222)